MAEKTASPSRKRENPWVMRTYSGHSSAKASNELYRTNLAKGQTGLSIAFDLPTQTGYDSDDPMARGEVGKVGVPVSHLGDMETLLDQIPLDRMNTSMTINATAAWLLALYAATAKKQGVGLNLLQGTTQNDIIKEYLSRGTHIYPPGPSMRLITDMVAYTVTEIPKWNPINICSYHLQEAGATPVQELAYALCTAIAVLDATRASRKVPASQFPEVVGRISFFCNAGIRFVEECCKMRAFVELWDRITWDRYGVQDPKLRRFRYGVQVNSLGLTESQPENNIQRIVLQMLAVTLSKDARARAIQLPAWNEALGLPRRWDQQWSLRIQQVLALETDLLEYDDILNGSHVIGEKVTGLVAEAEAEIAKVEAMGGTLKAVENGYIKEQLVASNARRVRAIESGEITVVGVNKFRETEPSPLQTGSSDDILVVDASAEREQIERLNRWRSQRDAAKVRSAIDKLKSAAAGDTNIMPASIEAALAGVTTGEWAQALRDVFGEWRAPTGVSGALRAISGQKRSDKETAVLERQQAVAKQIGHPVRFLVGKPGLDGHSNGAEQVAVAARNAGMEVIYEGIRLTPEQIAKTAVEENVDVVGLSILSGSHAELVPEVISRLRERGAADIPVIVGGILPEPDQKRLLEAGAARCYSPKDYELTAIMGDIIELVASRNRKAS
ncbi:MAG: protein meaA [Deltaproteobacteria bacterium]|nr:protein meaA [Deltaproteobacteria bacterium]